MDVKEKGLQKRMIIAIAAVIAVAIAALVLILALGRKEETYRSIKIIELEGSVTIERAGVGVLEASSNMNLISGDAVKTEQDAYAVLQLDSDKYVMLAESGSMTVVAEGDEANGRTAIQLDSGSVLNEIQNPLSSGSSYDIVTPNATMSVRGTVFEVRRNGDDSTGDIEVLVYDGKVAVGLDGKEPALYEAGEYTQFTAGQNPRFVTERAEIAEENLNPQFMERLEQINFQSRELNLGTAQLASAKTPVVAEPQQTPAVTPTEAPVQTETPVQTASPKPEAAPTASPKPQTGTGIPAVTTPAPSVTESPAVKTPAPEEDDDKDGGNRNEADNSGNTPTDNNTGNTGGNGSTGDSGNTGGNGNAGDSGNTGGNGNAGDSGNTGGNGSTGDSGNTGGNGSTGDSGNTGGNGNTGDSGNTGDNGNTGDSGNTGGNGNTGDSGNTGGNGNTGDSGNTGGNGNTGDSGNTGDNGNTGDSGNTGGGGYQDLWRTYTMAEYEQNVLANEESVSDGDAAAKECTVVFYLPYIVKPDGYVSMMRNDSPYVHSSVQVQLGSLLEEPETPVGNVNYSEASLTFVDWCLEDGTIWCFEDPVKADMCLYPIWKDDTARYFPVICRSAENWGYYHYCNCVKENTCLGGIKLSDSGDKKFKGWISINHGNKPWVGTSIIQGSESLKASWSD